MINYNRFLITSRVAGYDQNAFPTYEHFAIAELTPEQVKDFILRWCRANARRDYGSTISSQSEGDELFTKEAELMESKLVKVVSDHEGVKELAENPLLLTLLAVMQQNSIELPKERVELYKAVTSTLLENRNIAKGLPTIPEAQAIQRLGPIAFQMQETANSFLRRSDVLASLKQTILLEEGGTIDQVTQEAERFLSRVRERSGIFVQRTADYFGFFHRTFQEYFAARYMLNQIKNNSDYWIPEFAKKASSNDELWREPFLLAVAYKSSDDEVTARQLINTLLYGSNEGDIESHCHDLLLAVDCLIEAKPLTLGSQLEQQVAIKLLQFYEEVQRCQDEEEETCEQQEEACKRVELAIWRWLVSLPKESYRPAVVVVLCDALSDIQDVAHQRLILVLLAKIISISGRNNTYMPPVFFNTVIPLLLSIADLPVVGSYLPVPNLPPTPNPSIAAFALFILSLMNKQGPNGSLLGYVHQHFESHPESLRLLARFSLENQTLLLPVLAPDTEEGYKHYGSVLKKWSALCEGCHTTQVTEQDLAQCVDIYHALLASAEEIRYPIMSDLMNLLHIGEKHPDQPWKDLWQAYLLDQLMSVSYIRYQEIVLLWSILFPETPDMEKLLILVQEQMSNNDSVVRGRAQCFLAMLSYFRRDLQRERKLLHLKEREQKKSPMPIFAYNIQDKFNFGFLLSKKVESIYPGETITINLNFNEVIMMKNVMEFSIIIGIHYIQDFRIINAMRTIVDLFALRGLRHRLVEEELSHYAKLFLTHEMTERALYHLSSKAYSSSTDCVDLLMILLGRVLQIQEADERGDTITRELQQLAWTVCSDLDPLKEDETEVRLDIIRSLPSRSANEIIFVVRLAGEDTHEQIHQACAEALRDAKPQTSEDWKALEVATQSSLTVISTAAEECLKQKK